MWFEEVLPALRKGKMVRRSFWREDTYFYKNHQGNFIFKNGDMDEHYYNLSHLLDNDDWETVDPKKVKLRDLTPEQYKKWDAKNCKCGRIECRNCLFRRVECDTYHENVWYLHKDLYSDKFLDQEVEVEE